MSAAPAMKIRSIAPWFGGKRTLAPLIVEQLGKHTQYFEPFVGGMSILLAKPPSQKETVNDLHGDLTNLARVIQQRVWAEHLYERLQRVVLCEGLLEEARRRLARIPTHAVSDFDDHETWCSRMERAYWYFVASWMARNGVAGTLRVDYAMAVRWTKSGGSPTVRFRNATESLPAWHVRLQNVVILSRDAFSILDRFEDTPDTAIYVDPPYAAETRTGWRSTGSENRYLHEFSHHSDDALFGGQDDHTRLAMMLRAYKRSRIVVSYYDCPRIRELYQGWTFVNCERQKNLARQNGAGTVDGEAPEILIINGPEYPPSKGPRP